MKTLLTIFISVLVICQATAQDYDFKILVSQGENTITNGDSTSSIVPGTLIISTSSIELTANSYVGLVSSEGKTLELKAAGVFTSAQLQEKLLSSKSSNYATKYSEFVVDQMTENSNKHNYEISGSVDRGSGDIYVLVPSEIKAINNIPVTINWLGSSSKGYEVQITNMYSQVVYKTSSDTTSAELMLNEAKLKEGENYVLKVVNLETKSESKTHLFTFLDAEKSKEIYKGYSELTNAIDAESAIGQVIVAAYFDTYDLPVYSVNNYKTAATLEPEVASYNNQLMAYYSANGIKTK